VYPLHREEWLRRGAMWRIQFVFHSKDTYLLVVAAFEDLQIIQLCKNPMALQPLIHEGLTIRLINYRKITERGKSLFVYFTYKLKVLDLQRACSVHVPL
jgi:hypothetical protein